MSRSSMTRADRTRTSSTKTSSRRLSLAPAAPLWASAAVVLALIITVASERSLGSSARAEMVSQIGSLTVLTANSGLDELLVVLDERSERLLVYSAPQPDRIELRQGLEVADVFREARAASRGN